jgi:acyl-CoA thioester hydrolase
MNKKTDMTSGSEKTIIEHNTMIRVCYGDTDAMGVVYYGTYPRYYEISRTEMLRHYGIIYKEVEEKGMILPVRSIQINYLKPAFYDELLRVRSYIDELPLVRFMVKTEIYNSKDELINQGEVLLISTNPETGRAMRTPQWLLDMIKSI